jgi:FkbM family methyltransferase
MAEFKKMKIVNIIKKVFNRTPVSSMELEQYYKLSGTCQIPKLGFLYEKYFGQTDKGVFVEVGAYDGEYVSNTSCLADLGWQGHYIEPVPEYFDKCLNRHQQNTRTKVSNLAIGACNERVQINVSGPMSTIDKETERTFKNLPWAREHMSNQYVDVDQITLDRFLVTNVIEKSFDLLVIDVEGYEWEVLKGFDIQLWNPKMVIIELHDQNPDYPHLKEQSHQIVNYFEVNLYRIIYKDFSNTIYINPSLFDSHRTE